MKLTIKDRTEQPLLSREKIKAELAFEGPIPKRSDVFAELAAQAKVKPELLVVFKIASTHGSRNAKVVAFAYKNKEALDIVEEKKKFARTGFKEAKKEEKKEEAPAEAPKEAAPVEEAKKEEPKKEEAKE